MTTNNEAFEKFEKLFDESYPLGKQHYKRDKNAAWEGWLLAKAESASEIANLKLNIAAQEQLGYELQASNNRLQAKLTAEKEYVNELLKSSNHLFVENEQLKANNHDLREALGKIKVINDKYIKNVHIDHIVVNAIYSTPAESLQAHDDEVLDKLRPTRWTQKMNHAWNLAIPDLHKAFDDLIEALKGK